MTLPTPLTRSLFAPRGLLRLSPMKIVPGRWGNPSESFGNQTRLEAMAPVFCIHPAA